jgi:hypothetical protein
MRDVDAALGQQLEHLPAGERIGQVPADGGQDDVGRPAVAAEGRGGVPGERASTGTAGVLLSVTAITAVALGGGLLAGGAGRHGPPTLPALRDFPNSHLGTP